MDRKKRWTTISCAGDTEYRRALHVLAARRDMPVGTLVRQLIDEKYGEEISAELSYFANRNPSTHTITRK